MMLSLSDVELNRKCKIMVVGARDNILKRFIDMGIVAGNVIEKVLVSPFGGISAYYVMDSIIAIRDSDVKGVMVCYE